MNPLPPDYLWVPSVWLEREVLHRVFWLLGHNLRLHLILLTGMQEEVKGAEHNSLVPNFLQFSQLLPVFLHPGNQNIQTELFSFHWVVS